MGTTRVTRQVGAMSTDELQRWFRRTCEAMAEESGSGAYCGNWNACDKLVIVSTKFATTRDAEAYADKHMGKSDVWAFKVGDHTKAWPETKAQAALEEKYATLAKDCKEFEYRVLARAKAQKSSTKKCSHCGSAINVKALHLPELSELKVDERYASEAYVVHRFGRFLFATYAGLTDCPVCQKNLLMTETDVKNLAALKVRLGEASTKVTAAKAEYVKSRDTGPKPIWLVVGECPS